MLDAPPPTVDSTEELPSPKGPWSFLGQALKGGFSGWGLQLLAAWLAFQVLTGALWAVHLQALAGWSSLPSYWGEQVCARDLWELFENGGLRQHPTGPWVPLAAALALAWYLWAAWKMQAEAAGVRARFAAWAWSFLDALVLAAVPLGALGSLVLWILSHLAATGIQGLGWLDWVGGTLLRLSLVSAFLLQTWLCRLERAGQGGWNLGGWARLGDHLRRSFLRLWTHPVQWTALVVGGVAFRAGAAFLALLLGWRLGGGTPARVWSFLGINALSALAAAWQTGWFLRVTARFWRNDAEVRAAIRDLEAGTYGR